MFYIYASNLAIITEWILIHLFLIKACILHNTWIKIQLIEFRSFQDQLELEVSVMSNKKYSSHLLSSRKKILASAISALRESAQSANAQQILEEVVVTASN